MTARIIRGDSRALPLADESVDLVVTSPPYYALRSYTDGGEHYAGQIGSEATPAAYIAALVECTREWVRVLKPSGSIFVNLGDKYSGAMGQDYGTGASDGGYRKNATPRQCGIPAKSLMLLPERYRIACVDELGLIARAVIVWSKPNGLPESVTDRVRRAHEDWVHLTRRARYFSAVDEIREPHAPWRPSGKNALVGQQTIRARGQSDPNDRSTLGKLPGSVWEIATQPLTVPPELGVDHFAAFPTEWPRRLILGWSPSGICTACGEGRRPVSLSQRTIDGVPVDSLGAWKRGRGETAGIGNYRSGSSRAVVGEACSCPDTTAPTRPGVVLDPFGGTGTTALVASVLGRRGISVDMSADYCRLARLRTTDPGERAKAMRVPKPDPIHEDQLALWEAS